MSFLLGIGLLLLALSFGRHVTRDMRAGGHVRRLVPAGAGAAFRDAARVAASHPLVTRVRGAAWGHHAATGARHLARGGSRAARSYGRKVQARASRPPGHPGVLRRLGRHLLIPAGAATVTGATVTDLGKRRHERAPAGVPPAPAGALPLTAVPAPANGHAPSSPPGRTTTMPSAPPLAKAAPPDHAAIAARIAGFEPESDADLLRFMAGEIAGVAAQADALSSLVDTCLHSVGLDPVAVNGMHEYASAMTEAATAMKNAHAKFLARYGEVIAAVQAGVIMPHRGRWFSGESA